MIGSQLNGLPGDGITKPGKMTPDQMTRPHNIHFTENQWRALTYRAWDLNARTPGLGIGVSTLIRDIVVVWLCLTTNWEDPIYAREPMPVAPIGMPPERYRGYHADIGFEGLDG